MSASFLRPRPRFLAGLWLVLLCAVLTLLPQRAWAETLDYSFPPFEKSTAPERILGPAGEYFTFWRTDRNTNGKFSLAEAVIPPGAGPLPHVHTLTDEWFYFPNGGITLFCDPVHQYSDIKKIPGRGAPPADIQLISTKPGSVYYGPRYNVHGFYNNTDRPVTMIFVWTPDRITDYFREVGQSVPSFSADLKPAPENLELFVSRAPKYGINQSFTFMQYLRSVNPAGEDLLHMDDHLPQLESLLQLPLS